MSTLRDILVIDDEPTVTQAVVKVCGAEGMTVVAADHASEALRCLEESRFRLALCDIMMHGLDGFQFLEQLSLRGIQTPVVMMTGYSTVENAVKSLSSTGAVDYIPKPFTADELLTVIRRSLRCGMLQEEAESAGLARSNSMSYVPCPANYYRLGYVSWVLMEDEGTARIGVSDLFMKAAEGIRGFELSAPGEDLVQGIPCAVATSPDGSKHDIMCPMSGKILENNAQAQSNPSLVEKDPYFRGWLYRILPSNPQSNLQWLSL
jgi:CheY-like chemotaxis protein/glycine cleavage system H lipoate-binding protein